LHLFETRRRIAFSERLQLRLVDVEGRARQDGPAEGHAGKERGVAERTPIPHPARDRALELQHAEKAIDAELRAREVVRRGQARHDLAIETRRTEHDAPTAYADHEIGDRQLTVAWGAGSTEVRDLVFAHHRTAEDVAKATFGEVNDFREHGLGSESF